MIAYLIDTPNKTVRQVEYSPEQKIASLIHSELIAAVNVMSFPNGACDTIYVDDEGLLNGNPHGWFMLEGCEQPFRGYGLMLGVNAEGDATAPHLSLAWLGARLSFPEDSELKDPVEYAGFEVVGFDNAQDFLARLFGRKS